MPATSRPAAFAALHAANPGFVMPNAWDAGSALILAAAGFAAIGTTSAGIAFSLGRQDYAVDNASLAVSREAMLVRMRDIAAAVPLPVNGDLEAGFGDRPEDVAATVRMAIEAGLAGGNIEDKKPLAPVLYDEALAVERIVAARESIDAMGSAFVLTARTDAIQWSKGGVAEAIDRANRLREAGADCLFAPGVSDLPTIDLLAREIDGPLNMVMGLGNAAGNARDWIMAGAQRISLGGSIARAALGFVRRAADELRDEGTISFAEGQLPHAELNALFARHRAA
ncbi:isocitrate lyase/PEP mutase family protein [Chelatococcus reniformis]|uniref:2-methylisocitrate lyase n=1 Tax=Chelatococcus reniformis TaxID=1494448 RepID=A0A916UUB6_9HYPH|nr:isocitrate lyase/phosphoenolpyruvate mutase family protein [Chelatococcus reniformis]GGC88868.1 2-methylisocitrate lyase [Chelatococcus reniformis]